MRATTTWTRGLGLVLVLLWVGAGVGRTAHADDTEDARAEFNKGLGAFALGNYSEAAKHYESAFALKPDPAILYNAAQAHRLAGDKQRALLLYSNYLRLFGSRVKNQQEVNRHITALQSAIDSENKARTGPPLSTENLDSHPHGSTAPLPSEPKPDLTPAPPPPSEAPAVAPPVVEAAAPPPPAKPVYKKAWFWGVVGGAVVVVALGVGLGVGLSSPGNPTPALGVATVH